MKDIEKYSDPEQVYRNAIKYYGNDVDIRFSTRKNKKYALYDPIDDKWIHFGDNSMEDYTKHKNQMRREAFRRRNHKWANSPKYSPAYASYYLLW